MVSVTQSTIQPPPAGQALDLVQCRSVLTNGFNDLGRQLIEQAVDFAARAHDGQQRASGEPYLTHVLSVAEIVQHLGLDHEAVCAAILHDVVEDTPVTLDEVRESFGPDVARLVDGVTKMGQISRYRDAAQQAREHAESLRKLLLAMAEDIRVILIKLADRLHNMRTLRHLNEASRRRIARETLELYAPLANRLGIGQIKWELEDLSLRHMEPGVYKEIATYLDERRLDRERYIEHVVASIRNELKSAGIEGDVSGRVKHIYSIWRKMQRKNVGFNEIFDVRAVRIMVERVADCYAALGIVHSLWHHIPREFDDYIANPKENNYRSLHTAVVGPGGRTLEIQIRTREMHEHAELGVAAHWRYKEGGRFDQGFEEKIAWLRQLIDWRDEESTASDFVDRFKSETGDRVYVLTPQGEVVDLPLGGTPLDFAYHVHTEVGHRCRGAKVDGQIVPLTYELHNGEQVEILTTRNGTPSRDWLSPHLGYLKSSRARSKVRHWFHQQDRDKNLATGRAVLERELDRLGLNKMNWEDLAGRLRFDSVQDLLVGVANELFPREETTIPLSRPSPPGGQGDDVRILGVGNLLTHMARCCHPVPQDPIVGYITRGRGVTIHRRDCPNVLRLYEKEHERLIEVSWGGTRQRVYAVEIQILAYDRSGLLRDITSVLATEKINVVGVNTVTDKHDHAARMKLSIEISGLEELSRALTRIGQLPNVIEARRDLQH